MKIHVLTLFPEMFRPVMESSMLGRAVAAGILQIKATDIRQFSHDKHNKADDYPFGGGGGMVMMADPVFGAMESVEAENKKVIYMSPRGKILDREKIEELSKIPEMVILCGHYEGVDQRALDHWNAEEISLTDRLKYFMKHHLIFCDHHKTTRILIDSVARMIPGVLGNENSALDESVYSGLLEHPQYTKPREYRGLEVPEVLTSGNHKQIDLWRFKQSLALTKERRPDLLKRYLEQEHAFSKEERRILEEIMKMER